MRLPAEEYRRTRWPVRALNCLSLHADHEQNCSTSTVRMVGSARLLASISAWICALWGPFHGGGQPGRGWNAGGHPQRKGLTAQQFISQVKEKRAGCG